MRVGKITRLKLVVTVRKYFIQLQAQFSSRQEGTIIADEIVILLFYEIRYSRENNCHSFVFQKCKTTNGKPE